MRLMQTLALTIMGAATALHAQSGHPAAPPLRDFLLPREAEIALARSAAPPSVTDRATIKILTESGYRVAQPGDNGFVCMVLRGWSAPTFTPGFVRDLVYEPRVQAPICFNPVAARTVLPYQELRAKLGMAGKSPDEIRDAVEAAYANGAIPAIDGIGFAYMWSADQFLAPPIGAWRPHVMVYTPYYSNAMLGGHSFDSALPHVTDDEGTPFCVTVIPVDPKLAVHVQRPAQ